MTYPHNGDNNMQNNYPQQNNYQQPMAPQQAQNGSGGEKRPAASFQNENRRSIEAAVWQNFTKEGVPYFSTTFSRAYQAKDSETWNKQKVSLNDRDIEAAIEVLVAARDFMMANAAPQQQGQSQSQPQQPYYGGNNNSPFSS